MYAEVNLMDLYTQYIQGLGERRGEVLMSSVFSAH